MTNWTEALDNALAVWARALTAWFARVGMAAHRFMELVDAHLQTTEVMGGELTATGRDVSEAP